MNTQPIYLIAPSGNPNFGDEFIAASWLKYLAKTQPETPVYLDCPQPGLAQSLFSALHPKLRVTNTLWRAMGDAAGLPLDEQGPRVTRLVKNLGSPLYDLGLLQLRQAKSLHLLGGGYINGLWPQHYSLIDGMRAVRELTGARLFATGLGLMPDHPDPRVDAHSLFRDFEYASARDMGSSRTFALTPGIDDAYLGVVEEIGRNTLADASLCICIQSDTTDDGFVDFAVGMARDAIKRAQDENRSVFYFEAIPGGDRVVFDRLEGLIPESNFIPFTQVWSAGLPLSPNQTWLTTRFHFHLLASAAGASGEVIGAKKGYYDVKHQSLIDLGSGWGYVSQNTLATDRASNLLHRKLSELANRKFAEAQKLYPEHSWGPGDNSLRKHLLSAVKRRIGV